MTKPLRIALAGLGTVGAGVIRLLDTNGALIARRAGRPRLMQRQQLERQRQLRVGGAAAPTNSKANCERRRRRCPYAVITCTCSRPRPALRRLRPGTRVPAPAKAKAAAKRRAVERATDKQRCIVKNFFDFSNSVMVSHLTFSLSTSHTESKLALTREQK